MRGVPENYLLGMAVLGSQRGRERDISIE